MPATSKQIDAILKDKGVKFHSLYAKESRRWFVDFVLDAELKNGAAIAAATATCKKLIADILALLATLSTWALKDPIQTEKPKHLDVWSDRLVEIVYGVAAEAPAILSQSNYLGFIVRRRLRTVVRMQGYVNDLGGAWRRGYVTYQGDCRLGTTRVCEEATTLWAPVTPFTVAAGQTAVDALTALFAQSHPDPATSKCAFNPVTNTGHIELCKSNKFDCAHAVNAVSLDALLEAADPAVFLPTVQASSTRADYFSIRYPPRPAPPPEHVFWRPTAASKALFRRTAIPAPQISPVTGGTTPAASRVDLQTGDHIYIRNLPLFQAVAPDDVWQGEHSIVVKVGNRSFNNAKGFLFPAMA